MIVIVTSSTADEHPETGSVTNNNTVAVPESVPVVCIITLSAFKGAIKLVPAGAPACNDHA